MRMFIYVCCLKCPLLVEGLVNVNKVGNESRKFFSTCIGYIREST